MSCSACCCGVRASRLRMSASENFCIGGGVKPAGVDVDPAAAAVPSVALEAGMFAVAGAEEEVPALAFALPPNQFFSAPVAYIKIRTNSKAPATRGKTKR